MIIQILRREVRPGAYEVIVMYASGRSRTYKPGERVSKRALDFMTYHKSEIVGVGSLLFK